MKYIIFIWIMVLFYPGYSQETKEQDQKIEYLEGIEEMDEGGVPFFRGLVIESQEILPRINFKIPEEPTIKKDIPFYSDIRRFILELERENIKSKK